jgi:hypothetical protein
VARQFGHFSCKPKRLSPTFEAAADLSGGASLIDSKRQKKGMKNSALLTRVEIGPGLFAAQAESRPRKIIYFATRRRAVPNARIVP